MRLDDQRDTLRRRSLRHNGSGLQAFGPDRLRAGLVADALLNALDLLDLARAAVARGEAQRTVSAMLAASAAACAADALGDAPGERLREVLRARRWH